jgi:nucleoside-diphosphate-sugar epimerase
MKVCVIGAGGFIGQNLIKDTDWIPLTRKDVDIMNVCDFSEYDVVIHCAASIDRQNPKTCYENILMFENVLKTSKKLIYFSSGAALLGDPPQEPYGLSKWIIDKRIETLPNVYSLRIWGCYGPGELPTRFSAVCREKGHVVIQKDRYFDFINVMDVKKVVKDYVDGKETKKFYNLVYDKKMKLSEWAGFFGATYELVDEGLDSPYISPY